MYGRTAAADRIGHEQIPGLIKSQPVGLRKPGRKDAEVLPRRRVLTHVVRHDVDVKIAAGVDRQVEVVLDSGDDGTEVGAGRRELLDPPAGSASSIVIVRNIQVAGRVENHPKWVCQPGVGEDSEIGPAWRESSNDIILIETHIEIAGAVKCHAGRLIAVGQEAAEIGSVGRDDLNDAAVSAWDPADHRLVGDIQSLGRGNCEVGQRGGRRVVGAAAVRRQHGVVAGRGRRLRASRQPVELASVRVCAAVVGQRQTDPFQAAAGSAAGAGDRSRGRERLTVGDAAGGRDRNGRRGRLETHLPDADAARARAVVGDVQSVVVINKIADIAELRIGYQGGRRAAGDGHGPDRLVRRIGDIDGPIGHRDAAHRAEQRAGNNRRKGAAAGRDGDNLIQCSALRDGLVNGPVAHRQRGVTLGTAIQIAT